MKLFGIGLEPRNLFLCFKFKTDDKTKRVRYFKVNFVLKKSYFCLLCFEKLLDFCTETFFENLFCVENIYENLFFVLFSFSTLSSESLFSFSKFLFGVS